MFTRGSLTGVASSWRIAGMLTLAGALALAVGGLAAADPSNPCATTTSGSGTVSCSCSQTSTSAEGTSSATSQSSVVSSVSTSTSGSGSSSTSVTASCDASATSTSATSTTSSTASSTPAQQAAPALSLKELAVHVASFANTKRRVVDARLTVGAAGRLEIRAVHIVKSSKQKLRALATLPGSKVNGVVAGRKHTTFWYDLQRAGLVHLQLRLPLHAFQSGQRYALSVVATSATGARRTLTASFRLH